MGIRRLMLPLLFLSCVHTPEPHLEKVEAPLLWRGNYQNSTLYLFGTMHAGIDADRELPAVVYASLYESECFFMEANLADKNPAELHEQFEQYISLPPDRSLRAMIGEDHWAILMKDFGQSLSPERLDRYAPWVVVTRYLHALTPQTTEPMDQVLQTHADQKRLSLHYFETPVFQVKTMSEQITASDLKEILGDKPGTVEKLRYLTQLYRKGDDKALLSFMAEDNAGYSDSQMRAFFYDRNKRWVGQLIPLLGKKNCFVAVGAMHLLGKNGLLDLLTKEGVQFSRVLR